MSSDSHPLASTQSAWKFSWVPTTTPCPCGGPLEPVGAHIDPHRAWLAQLRKELNYRDFVKTRREQAVRFRREGLTQRQTANLLGVTPEAVVVMWAAAR